MPQIPRSGLMKHKWQTSHLSQWKHIPIFARAIGEKSQLFYLAFEFRASSVKMTGCIWLTTSLSQAYRENSWKFQEVSEFLWNKNAPKLHWCTPIFDQHGQRTWRTHHPSINHHTSHILSPCMNPILCWENLVGEHPFSVDGVPLVSPVPHQFLNIQNVQTLFLWWNNPS